MLHELTVINWSVRLRVPKVIPYRNVRGPDLEDVRKLLAAAEAQAGVLGKRDPVLLRLLIGLGLRRGEVAGLSIAHWDQQDRQLAILGKGRAEREVITVPVTIAARLNAYLDARGGDLPIDGALIACHGPFHSGGALSGHGIYRVMERLSAAARLTRRARPHGMRHAAITAALDQFPGDVRRVGAFARHMKLDTTIRYDDRRRDVAAEVANAVASLLDP